MYDSYCLRNVSNRMRLEGHVACEGRREVIKDFGGGNMYVKSL
jgi:hypothetical protein